VDVNRGDRCWNIRFSLTNRRASEPGASPVFVEQNRNDCEAEVSGNADYLPYLRVSGLYRGLVGTTPFVRTCISLFAFTDQRQQPDCSEIRREKQ